MNERKSKMACPGLKSEACATLPSSNSYPIFSPGFPAVQVSLTNPGFFVEFGENSRLSFRATVSISGLTFLYLVPVVPFAYVSEVQPHALTS